MCEEIIQDYAKHKPMKAVLLRYFNPVGAHPSAQIGELPLGVPNNLIPYVTQTAAGIRAELSVFGGDYPTDDGTAVVGVVVGVGDVVVAAAVVGDMLQQPYTFVGAVIYIVSVVVAYAFVAFVACVA